MKSFLLLVFGLFVLHFDSFAQDVLSLEKDQDANTGSISSLHWVAGYWRGTGLGGDCDELWLPAEDNSMVGIFRYLRDGSLVFSEYMHLVEENGRLYLKLKHFNRDLSPWEEKEKWTTFKFIKTEGQTAYFSGITFHREGNKMILRLALNRNG